MEVVELHRNTVESGFSGLSACEARAGEKRRRRAPQSEAHVAERHVVLTPARWAGDLRYFSYTFRHPIFASVDHR